MQQARRDCVDGCSKPGMEDKAKKCNEAPFSGMDSCSGYLACMGY